MEGYWVAYVGNISFEVTPEELKEVFADVGVDKVISPTLPLGRPRVKCWHDFCHIAFLIITLSWIYH